MAWTATKDRIAKDVNGDLAISITYTNGTDTKNEVVRASSPTLIEQLIVNRIDELDGEDERKAEVDAFVATATPGPVVIADTTDTPVISDIDKARMAFFSDYSTLKKMLAAVNAGILGAQNAQLIALQTKLSTALKNNPDFINSVF